jgi:hypothetical protein
MRKFGILSLAFLFTTGVAIAGESMMQSEKSVKEKTTQSTTNLQDNADVTGEVQHKSTTVEKQRQTTSDDMDGMTASEKIEVEKSRSKTTTESGDDSIPGSTQEYRQQSETHHHSSTEVEKK